MTEAWNAYMRSYRKKAPSTKEENPHDPRIPPEHGTPSMYASGCPCKLCKMANRDRQRVHRTGSAGPEESLLKKAEIGTRACYVTGCDHDECRKANAEYQKEYMKEWRRKRATQLA